MRILNRTKAERVILSARKALQGTFAQATSRKQIEAEEVQRVAIKIKAADKWFSKCVRERAGWKCERCGAQHNKSSQGLHCSHYVGRGSWSVRFDPENAEALCYGCHSLMGANPNMHAERKLESLGAYRMDALLEKKNDSSLGRQAKREEKHISKHYRQQLKKMELAREGGDDDRIEFEGYL